MHKVKLAIRQIDKKKMKSTRWEIFAKIKKIKTIYYQENMKLKRKQRKINS